MTDKKIQKGEVWFVLPHSGFVIPSPARLLDGLFGRHAETLAVGFDGGA